MLPSWTKAEKKTVLDETIVEGIKEKLREVRPDVMSVHKIKGIMATSQIALDEQEPGGQMRPFPPTRPLVGAHHYTWEGFTRTKSRCSHKPHTPNTHPTNAPQFSCVAYIRAMTYSIMAMPMRIIYKVLIFQLSSVNRYPA